jgi:hypothetical protein
VSTAHRAACDGVSAAATPPLPAAAVSDVLSFFLLPKGGLPGSRRRYRGRGGDCSASSHARGGVPVDCRSTWGGRST